MQKSLRSALHSELIVLLIAARRKAELTQAEVASLLERPQSFVAKYENGERRIDVIEFIFIAKALGADPAKLFSTLIKRASRTFL